MVSNRCKFDAAEMCSWINLIQNVGKNLNVLNLQSTLQLPSNVTKDLLDFYFSLDNKSNTSIAMTNLGALTLCLHIVFETQSCTITAQQIKQVFLEGNSKLFLKRLKTVLYVALAVSPIALFQSNNLSKRPWKEEEFIAFCKY